MRRDMDLIRELMLRLEAFPMRRGGVISIEFADDLEPDDPFAVPGFTGSEVAYHLQQIERAGFIDCGGFRPMSGIGFRCLTPAGHDFIDSVRDAGVWTTTKDKAGKAGGWTLGILRDIGVAILKGEVMKHGLPIG